MPRPHRPDSAPAGGAPRRRPARGAATAALAAAVTAALAGSAGLTWLPTARPGSVVALWAGLLATVALSWGARRTPRAPHPGVDLPALAEQATLGIALKDDAGRYVYANPHWVGMHLRPGVDPVGQVDTALFAPDAAEVARDRDTEVRTHGSALETREVVPTDGGVRTYLTVRYPIDTGDERLVGIVSVDVTTSHRQVMSQAEDNAALREQVDELERSNRDLTDFAYIASHDLAEPLRVVSGYVQLLSRRYADELDDKAQRWIGFTVEGVQRMEALIRDLLTYSRLGGEPAPPEPVDLGALVTATLSSLDEAITEADARILVDSMPVVDGDAGQLGQLLQNLVGNALKFRSSERPLVVRLSAVGGPAGWRIAVSDNGIGVPPENRERIFRMFHRLHLREDYPGTGIGLAIARRIVEQHGGTITVGEGDDGGVRFDFTLPSARTARADTVR